ncbi:ShlB/FhaC/HecB family hemolysin secretion/activation protein [Reyranella sp. CPCC 100927]|uniref:ShlB/FhaC/HecB family hemolysin secretion/activation protein n=1 Tax=Reyranella sp. CPCC 100927 TaxID=2599616 RepID=UPI0011B52220|nr:POTRA domain-containing protein [Reyranella sp. CPCC 100927]TWT15207.1 ShlB/FhaC/HecB family hemolysin secretion/activation protein [Reyranella sp. CPCC 100927]
MREPSADPVVRHPFAVPRRGVALCVAALSAALSSVAVAQVPPVLQAPPVRPGAPEVPRTPDSIPAAPPGTRTAPPGADQIFATPSAIDIEGATVYPPGVLDELTRPVVGRRVAVSELFAVAQRIEAKYRADGYFLTTVFLPAQRVADGRVKIRVVEGYISNVVVEGNVGDVASQARRFLDKMTLARPANLRDVERYLLLTQDMPGVSMKAVLRPGKEPGSSELVAQLQRKSWDGLLQVNNRGSKFTGQQQGTFVVGSNSWTGLAERLEATFFTTFDREQNFGQLNWSNYIGGDGLQLRAYFGRGRILPDLQIVDYDGKLTVAGISLLYPVIRSRQLNLNVFGGYDYYHSNADLIVANSKGGFTRTDLSVLRFGADANYRDDWNGVTFGNVRFSQGINAFGSTKRGDPFLNRLGADPTFFKFNGEVNRLQGIWTGAGFSLNVLGSLAGQYSGDILPSNEKYFVGGERLGRGYYSGQVTGDKAVAGSLELQLNFSIAYDEGTEGVGGPSQGGSLPMQLYVFYDHARVWNNAPGEIRHQTARSFGGGIRVSILESVALELEATRRLDRDVDGAAARRLDPWNLYGRVTARF